MIEFDEDVVLFVDDEERILSSLRRACLDEPFRSMYASSGEEALQMMARQKIGIIVTDMKMPGMDGLTLLKQCLRDYPDTVRIVLSGYSQLPQILATVNNADIFRFIVKPWKSEEDLLPAIHAAFAFHHAKKAERLLEQSLRKKTAALEKIFTKAEGTLSDVRDLIAVVGQSSSDMLDRFLQVRNPRSEVNHASIFRDMTAVLPLTAFPDRSNVSADMLCIGWYDSLKSLPGVIRCICRSFVPDGYFCRLNADFVHVLFMVLTRACTSVCGRAIIHVDLRLSDTPGSAGEVVYFQTTSVDIASPVHAHSLWAEDAENLLRLLVAGLTPHMKYQGMDLFTIRRENVLVFRIRLPQQLGAADRSEGGE